MFSLSLSFFFQSLFCFIYGWGSLPHDKKKFMFFLNDWKSLHFFFLFPVLVEVQQYQSKGALHVSWQVLCWIQACFFFFFFSHFFLYPLLTLTS